MSVYVDQLQICLPFPKWRFFSSCHLMADAEEELHSFAQRLGLQRSWFQSKSIAHYDLTQNKRRQAVKFGAIEISRKQFVELLKKQRIKGA